MSCSNSKRLKKKEKQKTIIEDLAKNVKSRLFY